MSAMLTLLERPEDRAFLTGGALIFVAAPEVLCATSPAADLRPFLDAGERARAEAFVFERDRLLFVVAHALVRATIGWAIGVAPQALRFVIADRGRPELAPPFSFSGLRFNLSHTQGYVACGLTIGRDIGVDIERRDRAVDMLSLARSVLSGPEQVDLLGQQGPQQRARFFELWTLKEAYLKAVGQGLGLPLPAISFSFSGAPPVDRATVRLAPEIDDVSSRLSYHCYPIGDGHQLAVAVEGPAPVAVRALAAQELRVVRSGAAL